LYFRSSKPVKSKSKPAASSSSRGGADEDGDDDRKASKKGGAKSRSKAQSIGGGTRKMMWMNEPLAAFMGTAQDAVDNPMEVRRYVYYVRQTT
jgi:hypothetical protein